MDEGGSAGAVVGRALAFGAVAAAGVGIVLLPYWLSILQHPIKQVPIPHASRSNLLMNVDYFINYFLVPYGAFILALPFIVIRGASVPRLRPLLLAFWFTFILSIGGTTPLPRWILGRAFEILTYERFTLWAVLLGLPIVGMWAEDLIDRHRWKAASAFATAAVATIALAMGWLTWSPFRPTGGLDVSAVIEFLNRDGHDQYRYLTLGFGNALPKLSTYANAGSVDGEYNSARLLPEMTNYGSAQFTSAKYFGTAGMESLKAMLRHANHYGLKYIFVYDPYYEPLLVFTGWRQIEKFNQGAITAWVKDDVGPAHKIYSDAMPTAWEGLLWGTLPIGSSILAIFLVILLPDRRRTRVDNILTIPAAAEPVYAREVQP
jgi:TRAP-type C4-dicarboxylate transport system permease small subunit